MQKRVIGVKLHLALTASFCNPSLGQIFSKKSLELMNKGCYTYSDDSHSFLERVVRLSNLLCRCQPPAVQSNFFVFCVPAGPARGYAYVLAVSFCVID
jgi:hypothetical protein